MATELATAYVSLALEGSRLPGQLTRELSKTAPAADTAGKTAGKRFSGGMLSGAKGLAAGLGAMLVAVGVKDFIGDALGEARESQRVGALTESIVRSTGGAAKITAAQVGDLAGAISQKTGVDDEAIQSGANLLLTFKNVRNETGKGNDVFNQATAAALDLSKAGFGSVEGSSKMLGKALNDPLKGISALGRAGVTFTDEQKKMIEGMVKGGDVLGAQKIILGEVQSQVGGAAEATATAGDKARVTFDNLKESAGTYLLPIVDKLAAKFVELVTEFQNGVGTGGQIRDILDRLGGVVAFLGDHMTAVKVAVAGLVGGIVAWKIASLGLNAVNAVQLALLKAQTVGTVQHAIVSKTVSVATKLWAAGQWLLNAALNANPIGLIVALIAGLIAIVVVAYQKNETFRNIVNAAWSAVKAGIKAVVDWVVGTAWPWIRNAFQWIVDKAVALKDKVVGAWSALRSGVSAAWSWVKTNVLDRLVAAFVWVVTKAVAFKDANLRAWDLLKAGLSAAWSWIKTNVLDRFIAGLVFWRDRFVAVKDSVVRTWDLVKAALKAGWDWVAKNVFTPFKTGLGLLATKFGDVKDTIGRVWDGLKEKAKAPIKFVIDTVLNKGLIGAFNWVSGKIGGPHVDPIKIAGFRTGGVLPGYTPGRDVHRFVSPTGGILDLSGGEGILLPQRVRELGGAAGIKALNDGTHPLLEGAHSYAGGGVLDWLFDKASSVYKAVTHPIDYLKSKLPKMPGGFMGELAGGVKDKLLGTAVTKIKALWDGFGGGGGANGIGSKAYGWRQLWAIVHKLLPGIQLTSAYRPGAITALGNKSLHGMGRAIDVAPPSMAAFNAIRAAFPNATQLFYGPADGRTLLRGKPWRMDPVTKRNHFDHIHLAMRQGGVVPKPLLFDRGGVLPAGTSLVHNGTGAPEPLARVDQAGSMVVYVNVSIDDLAKLNKLDDFLGMLDRARLESRAAASGRVSA